MRSSSSSSPTTTSCTSTTASGCICGLKHLSVAGSEGDFRTSSTRAATALPPVDRVNLVQKYVGGDGAKPLLDKLGSATGARQEEDEGVDPVDGARAAAALRHARPQREPRLSTDDPYYQEFEARFLFDETPDQQRAINEVLEDLGKPKPMDWLVWWRRRLRQDRGRDARRLHLRDGKAGRVPGPDDRPRAAAHRDLPQALRWLSRAHRVDVELSHEARERRGAGARVGPARLRHRRRHAPALQPDVDFERLGLLVVDEEHRFGVRTRERIKRMRKLVDVLTLTATPIPRTLELSLTGIRDLSVIETPSLDRQAIRTYVTKLDDNVLRSILRELRRGGQGSSCTTASSRSSAWAKRARSGPRGAHHRRARPDEGAPAREGHAGLPSRRARTSYSAPRSSSPASTSRTRTRSSSTAPTPSGWRSSTSCAGRVGRSPARVPTPPAHPGERLLTQEARPPAGAAGARRPRRRLQDRGARSRDPRGREFAWQAPERTSPQSAELYTQMMEQAVRSCAASRRRKRSSPSCSSASPYIPDAYIDDVNQRLTWYKRLAALKRAEDKVLIAEEMRPLRALPGHRGDPHRGHGRAAPPAGPRHLRRRRCVAAGCRCTCTASSPLAGEALVGSCRRRDAAGASPRTERSACRRTGPGSACWSRCATWSRRSRTSRRARAAAEARATEAS